MIAIRKLNDTLRTTLQGGQVVMTPGVCEMPDDDRVELLTAVMSFDQFDHGCDPHGEHDF